MDTTLQTQDLAKPRQVPAYRSHKKVHAFQIGSISPTTVDATVPESHWAIIPRDPGLVPALVTAEWYAKHKPSVDGYFVMYADGYESFSPAKAFEEGNTLITDLPAAVNAQYVDSKIKEAFYAIMPDGRTTICMLIMKNGFTITGSSVCQPTTEFNKEAGERWAYEDAFGKAWPFEVYMLAEQKLQAGS
ncbi:Gp49 family protein [Polaromonas sp.]|uniref:Gp49 family protein n=1 Tax=Polaromonas sp. TaxID=1869339 RepID=UPI00326731E5